MSKLRWSRTLVSLLVASGLAIGLFGVPRSAGADPVTYLPAAGTPISIKFINHESLVDVAPAGLSIGDTLSGVFTATSIEPPLGGGPAYWTPGVDGTELNGFFTGLTVAAFSTDPVSGIVTTAYTGGTATVYNVAAGTFAPAGGPVPAPAAMLCGGACPAPWVTFSWVPQLILPGPTPITQITTFNPATGTGAGLTAWLDATGGTAFSYFNNNSFATPLGASADGTIASTFAACPPGTGCALGWGFLSNDPIQSQVAPEPTTILLWGTVLLGMGVARRRFSARLGG